jgi:hypothetical protein
MSDMSINFDHKQTDEELRAHFSSALKEISFTSGELLSWMTDRGDYRDSSATIRSIQRMMAGDTRVSGTMMVLVNTLVRQHRRLKAEYPNLVWSINERGVHIAEVDGWYIYVSPQSKGRWILSCSNGPNHKDYSPPFGRWLDSLEEAKNKALMSVEEGKANLADILLQR